MRDVMFVMLVCAGCRAAPVRAPAASGPAPAIVTTTQPVCDPMLLVEVVRDEPDPDDLDTKTRRERAGVAPDKQLVARLQPDLPTYRAACDVTLAGACAAQADLDGDGQRDELVLVRSDRGVGGLAILWGKGGAALLGAGVRCQQWTVTELANLDGSPIPEPSREEVPADLDWLRLWEVWRREGDELVSPGKRRVPANGALGDAILLDGGDAAVLVHRGADGWVQVHLGY